SVAREGTDGVDRHVAQPAPQFVDDRGGRVAEIALGENQDGLAAGQVGRGEETLQPAGIQVPVEGSDEKQDVEVGGEDLFLSGIARGLAGQLVDTGKHGLDNRRAGIWCNVEGYPIADRREVSPAGGSVPQPAADLGGALTLWAV